MIRAIAQIILFLGLPFTFLASVWLKFVKKVGTGKIGDYIFMKVGILPILDHYYQPLINPKKYLTKSRDDRELPGIDFNTEEQLSLLKKFNYNEELLRFPLDKRKEAEYYYNNEMYSSGDAEYLYNIVRHFKPKRIIEVGSGNSTLMARNAIVGNQLENVEYACHHICIEPYEQSWLEDIEVELIREKVETVDKALFQKLQANDILFIDSSHIIRPQGDVLFEYLEILPTLKPGVLIHIHDVFTPMDYPDEWIYKRHNLWNEQYLMEAFLTFNSQFKVIGALNYLAHNYHVEFSEKCPFFAAGKGFKELKKDPRAFWIVRV